MARFLLLICNFFIGTTIVVQSYDLKCEIKSFNWIYIGEISGCYVNNANVTSRIEEITSVNGRTEPTNLLSLQFDGKTLNYLPKGIDKFFPNLKRLAVWDAKLKSLTQDDLKLLNQLEATGFSGNDLESLEDNLYEFNTKLVYSEFNRNKLKYVGGNIMNNLKFLKESHFISNPCINAYAAAPSQIPALVQKIKSQCTWCRAPVLINEIDQLKVEISDLKTKNIQNVIEMNSKNSEIIRQANLIKAHEMQRRENEDLIKQLNTTIGGKNLEIDVMKTDKTNLIKTCEVQAGKYEDLIKQLNTTISGKNSEIDSLKTEKTIQANLLKACEAKVVINEDLIRQLNTTNGEMNSVIIALKADKTNLTKVCETQAGKYEDSIRQLNATIGEMKSEIDSSKAEKIIQANLLKACEAKVVINEDLIRQLNTTNGEMNSVIIALKADKTNLTKVCETQAGKYEDSIRQLNATIGEMKSEIDSSKAEKIIQANLVKACEAKLVINEDLIRQLNATNGEMNSVIIALKAEKTDLTKACETQAGKNEDSIRQLNATIAEKNIKIDALKTEITGQANLTKACEIKATEYEDSIKQLIAFIDEMKNKPLQLCKDESLKLHLEACDGNLNAVTEILFKTSDHQHIFTQLPSDLLNLIVGVDGSRFTAIKLAISSPVSKVNSVIYANSSFKFVNDFDVDIQATELCIDHQQTIFLPTNLGHHFPVLQILEVTSSGLIQVDSSVFDHMNNLKVLKLNCNQLQEIQPGTFDQLKLLETLDLCSNNLKYFAASAIIGLEKLQILNLADNRLKVISSNILDPLKVLQIADLSNNDCINLSYPIVTLKKMEDQISKDCMETVKIECFTLGTDHNEIQEIQKKAFNCIAVDLKIVHPKTRISKLKNQLDFNSFTFSVIDQHIAFLPILLSETFTNLHVLIVIRSKLTALNQRDFEGLKNLKSITIVNNNISLIEPGVFDDVPQLEHLNLSFNNIQTLPAMSFVRLAQLKTLNLSDNQLQSLFSGLLPLNNIIEEFHIRNNEIKKTDLANSMNLKRVRIIDLTDNVCIGVKYEKGNTDCKTLSELFRALRACLL